MKRPESLSSLSHRAIWVQFRPEIVPVSFELVGAQSTPGGGYLAEGQAEDSVAVQSAGGGDTRENECGGECECECECVYV